MSEQEDNGFALSTELPDPAYPMQVKLFDPVSGEVIPIQCGGLTRREYFAAAALQGLLSQADRSDIFAIFADDTREESKPEARIAARAYKIADAMMKVERK